MDTEEEMERIRISKILERQIRKGEKKGRKRKAREEREEDILEILDRRMKTYSLLQKHMIPDYDEQKQLLSLQEKIAIYVMSFGFQQEFSIADDCHLAKVIK